MENTYVKKRGRGRPPKQERTYDEVRETLIRAGLALLTEKGFSAVGVDEISRRVDVPKGSFYYYFKSKEAFGAELIDRYGVYFSSKLDRFLMDESRFPLQRIRDFIADRIIGMGRHDFRRGCLVGNLGQEMNSLPETFRARVEEVFLDWQTRLEKCFLKAKEAGEIVDDVDCGELAAVFWIGWEGAVLRAKLERNPKPLILFADFFFQRIVAPGRAGAPFEDTI